MNIYITHWTWQCGNGCCDDSGTEIRCGTYHRQDLPSLEEQIPAWIISDMLWIQLQDKVDCQTYKERFFASVGERYDGSDWCWDSHLRPLSNKEIIKLFADFDFVIDKIVTNNEER